MHVNNMYTIHNDIVCKKNKIGIPAVHNQSRTYTQIWLMLRAAVTQQHSTQYKRLYKRTRFQCVFLRPYPNFIINHLFTHSDNWWWCENELNHILLTWTHWIWVEMQPSLLLIEWYWQLTIESIYFAKNDDENWKHLHNID